MVPLRGWTLLSVRSGGYARSVGGDLVTHEMRMVEDGERRIAMRMTSRKRKPPVARISITSNSPAEEIQMLRRLMGRLNETVQSLWDTVHELRLELYSIRPAALDLDPSDQRPPTWLTPPASAAVAEQVETLQRQVDELNGEAEYLWFEAQWLRAQLVVYRGDGSTTYPAHP